MENRPIGWHTRDVPYRTANVPDDEQPEWEIARRMNAIRRVELNQDLFGIKQ